MELQPLPSKSPHHLCFCITTNFSVLSSFYCATFHTLLPRDQPSKRGRPVSRKLKGLMNKNSPIQSTFLGPVQGLPGCATFCFELYSPLFPVLKAETSSSPPKAIVLQGLPLPQWCTPQPWAQSCWFPGVQNTECLTLKGRVWSCCGENKIYLFAPDNECLEHSVLFHVKQLKLNHILSLRQNFECYGMLKGVRKRNINKLVVKETLCFNLVECCGFVFCFFFQFG